MVPFLVCLFIIDVVVKFYLLAMVYACGNKAIDVVVMGYLKNCQID
jgi:hypothetical protein